jgi:UDP-2-acetamido-2-deoxy-ribo-hexuluronate aminotransferase
MIPFIDLKSQYSRVEDQMLKRFKAVMEHGQYIMGPEIKELEDLLADYIGAKHCISLSSGTDALLIALMALDIGAGDEVIVPDLSFFGSAEVVEILGAKSIFCDVDPVTYNLDPLKLEGLITKKTKAIMPVSLYGQCADFDEINAIGSKFKIPVIEDGAQSFGAIYKNKKSLNLSLIGCTSFFPSKPLGCYGDGGACFTNDDSLALAMKELRTHGQSKRYVHSRIGLNARMDTLQAAFLVEKMKIFEDEVERRLEVARRYNEGLRDFVKVPFIKGDNRSVYAQYSVLVSNRDQVLAKLNEQGVPTAIHYPEVLSKQPVFDSKRQAESQNMIAKEISQKVFSLPMHPYLSEVVQKEIIEKVKKAVG